MNYLNYLLEFSGCLIIFYTLYFFLFRKETFSQLNRIYLLSSLIISLFMPVIPSFITVSEVPKWAENAIYESVESDILVIESENIIPKVNPIEPYSAVAEEPSSRLTLSYILWSIYLLGVIFVFLKLLLNITKIAWHIKNSHIEKKAEYILVNSQQPLVCSFFNYIFWNNNLPFSSSEKEQMIAHELAHVKEGHTFDILFLEILMVVFWFHPLIYFYKKAIKNVHEYIADSYVFYDLNYKSSYAQLLIKEATQIKTSPIVNTFFNSLTKNRLIMLSRETKPLRKLRLLTTVPMFSLLVVAFGIQFTLEKQFSEPILQNEIPISSKIEEPKEAIIPRTPEIISENNESTVVAKEESTSKLLDNEPPKIDPKIIAALEAKGNPWSMPLVKNPVFVLFDNYNSNDFLFKKDGTLKSFQQLRKEKVIKEKERGRTVTERQVVFTTFKMRNEHFKATIGLFDDVEIYFTGGTRLEWTGIENGRVNSLTKPENQIFKFWDEMHKQYVEVENYCMSFERNDKLHTFENIVTPSESNMFTSPILQKLKTVKRGDKIVFYDFRYQVNGKYYLNRDEYEFVIR